MSLRNTPNQYWGHAAPPPDCCMSVVCSALDRASFIRYVKTLAKDGCYYSHDTTKRTVTLAFASPQMREVTQKILEYKARKEGALIETN